MTVTEHDSISSIDSSSVDPAGAHAGIRHGAVSAREGAFVRRFGVRDDDGPWNDTLAVQFDHRSVRRFTEQPIDEDIVRTLVAAASSAPTSSNLQLWSVVAVTDRERVGRLAALAGDQDAVRHAPLFLVWLADFARAERIVTARGLDLHNADYAESTLLGVIDATLAAQNAVVAAESLGLGTVFIGGIRNDPETVAEILGLPPRVFPVVGLSVGWPDPDETAEVKPRLGFDVVCHREGYRIDEQDHGIAEYDVRAEGFYRSQGLVGSWTGRIVSRLTDPAAFGPRRGIRQALASRGFPFT